MSEFKIYTQKEKEARADLIKQMKRELSVAEVATNLYGLKMMKSKRGGRYLKTLEHSSMVFDLRRNCVFWNAKTGSSGLNVIDFIMTYEDISGTQAINKAMEYYRERDGKDIDLFLYNQEEDNIKTTRGIVYPKENISSDAVFSYLHDVRKINEALITKLMNSCYLYEDENNNCVFVGYNEKLDAKFGCIRGTRGNKYQMDCVGSQKSIGFYYETNYTFKKLALFESVIDGLSYMSLKNDIDTNILCSSGAGNVLSTLKYHIQARNYTNLEEVILCLDTDDAGQVATENVEKWLKDSYYNIKVTVLEYEGKDMNECLIETRKKEEAEELLQSIESMEHDIQEETI